jgi:hypothetical protein
MGETASTWKLPLHSSDSEHEWMKIREEKGKGGAFRINRTGRTFPGARGNPIAGIDHPGVNASSVLTNPFHHTSEPKPNHGR